MSITTALHPASLERLPGEAEHPPLRLLETPRRPLLRAAAQDPLQPPSRTGWWRWLSLGLTRGDLL